MRGVLLAVALGRAAAVAPQAGPPVAVSRVFLRVRSVLTDMHLDKDHHGRKVDPFAFATNATNASNFTSENLTISQSPLSSPNKAKEKEEPPPAAYPKQEGVTLPTMLPPPYPVKLSLPLGPNPMTQKQQEAIDYTVSAKAAGQQAMDYTKALKERLVNASIESETIMTGRQWGTPGPPVPHRESLEGYYRPLQQALPVAIRQAVRNESNMSANYTQQAAVNATEYFKARLAAYIHSLPKPNATNASNASNASNGSNATALLTVSRTPKRHAQSFRTR
jgi:hypothetical protein